MAANDLSPVVEQLKVMYKQKILPLEKDYKSAPRRSAPQHVAAQHRHPASGRTH
jgi:hypothetical protein